MGIYISIEQVLYRGGKIAKNKFFNLDLTVAL